MRASRFALVSAGISLALQGCSLAPKDTRAVYEPVTDVAKTTAPMAQIAPEAGEVVSVLQSRENGVLTQRIVLQGDAATGGENEIVVSVDQGDRRPGDYGGLVKPTETSIQDEIDKTFGPIDMRLSLTWNRNSFGPFGYAIGHAAHGVTCIYAWQYSPGRQLRLVGAPDAMTSAPSTPATPTSLRVRLCLTKLDEKQIVALIGAMQVYPPGSTAPYLDPGYERTAGASRDALQASGVPGAFFLAPAGDAPKPDKRRHAHAHMRKLAPASDTLAPATRSSGALAVPLPAGARAASATAGNPLLAPLQAVAPRAPVAGEMPLPATLSPPKSADARPAPTSAPFPLPN